MVDVIFGLPVHTIVVHAVVILVPLAALATIAVAIRPAWRARWIGWVVVANALAVVLTYVARESGKKLYGRLDSIGGAEVADDHRRLGLALIWFVLVFFGLSVLAWIAARSEIREPLPAVVAIVTAVAAAAVLYWVIRVGHSGTDAVWGDLVDNTSSSTR